MILPINSEAFLGLIAETEKSEAGVYAISVLPMPDTRQAQKNAVPNQSDGNVEGSALS